MRYTIFSVGSMQRLSFLNCTSCFSFFSTRLVSQASTFYFSSVALRWAEALMSLLESLSLLRGGCFLGLRSGSLIFLVGDLWMAVGVDAGGSALTTAFFSSFSPSAFINKICSTKWNNGQSAITDRATCIQIIRLQLRALVLVMHVWQLLVIVIWDE